MLSWLIGWISQLLNVVLKRNGKEVSIFLKMPPSGKWVIKMTRLIVTLLTYMLLTYLDLEDVPHMKNKICCCRLRARVVFWIWSGNCKFIIGFHSKIQILFFQYSHISPIRSDDLSFWFSSSVKIRFKHINTCKYLPRIFSRIVKVV